jgi:ribosomal protein L32
MQDPRISQAEMMGSRFDHAGASLHLFLANRAVQNAARERRYCDGVLAPAVHTCQAAGKWRRAGTIGK